MGLGRFINKCLTYGIPNPGEHLLLFKETKVNSTDEKDTDSKDEEIRRLQTYIVELNHLHANYSQNICYKFEENLDIICKQAHEIDMLKRKISQLEKEK